MAAEPVADPVTRQGTTCSPGAHLQAHAEAYIQEMENKNTLRKVKQKHFEKSQVKKHSEMIDFKDLPARKLDQCLAGWILDLKKEDSTDYKPNMLSSFVHAVGKYLRDSGSSHDIMNQKKIFKSYSQSPTSKEERFEAGGEGKPT